MFYHFLMNEENGHHLVGALFQTDQDESVRLILFGRTYPGVLELCQNNAGACLDQCYPGSAIWRPAAQAPDT